GDEMWQLFDVELSCGVRRTLTPAGARAFLLKTSDRHPNQVLVSLNLDTPLHDVYRLDLGSAELTKIVDNPGFVGFLADHDLRVRAALAPVAGGGMVIMVRDDEQA